MPSPVALNKLLPSTATCPAATLEIVVSDACPIFTPANCGESSVCVPATSTFTPLSFI